MKESLQGPSWPHQEKKKKKAALLDSIALPSPEGRPGCPLTERTRCTLVINLSMRDESDNPATIQPNIYENGSLE